MKPVDRRRSEPEISISFQDLSLKAQKSDPVACGTKRIKSRRVSKQQHSNHRKWSTMRHHLLKLAGLTNDVSTTPTHSYNEQSFRPFYDTHKSTIRTSISKAVLTSLARIADGGTPKIRSKVGANLASKRCCIQARSSSEKLSVTKFKSVVG